jgi:hypothetical protein
MIGWNDFFTASAGASAALAGLLFVGLSINLKKIISIQQLPSRALAAMILLAVVLVVSLLGLVPGQRSWQLGLEFSAAGVVSWLVMANGLWITFKAYQDSQKRYAPKYSFVLRLLLGQCATLPYFISGLLLVLTNSSGPYWLVPAFVFSFIVSLYDVWVLLVEINR